MRFGLVGPVGVWTTLLLSIAMVPMIPGPTPPGVAWALETSGSGMEGPTADAGPDLSVREGQAAVLDGSGSRPAPAGTGDELSWVPEPGLRIDTGSSIDSIYAFDPDTLVLPNGSYRMYYVGWDGMHRRIVSAISDDGLSWVKEPGLRVDIGLGYDSVNAYDPEVVLVPTGYRMYYAGFDGSIVQILSARSDNGVDWIKEVGVRLAGSSDVFDPDVLVLENKTLRMYYDERIGGTIRIASAFSSDGLLWAREGGVRLVAGGSYDSSFVAAAEVMPSASHGFRMFYHGNDFVHSRILSASSDDGLSWTKDEGIRVDVSSPYGTSLIGYPDVVQAAGGGLRLYYGAYDGNHYRVLSARSLPSSDSPIVQFSWDLNDLEDSDADGNVTNDQDLVGDRVTAFYGDNGVFNATLRILDDQGRTDVDTAIVIVENAGPTVDSVAISSTIRLSLRIAGEKWHDAALEFLVDQRSLGRVSVTRRPGDPHIQSLSWGDVYMNGTHVYGARVIYTPEDDFINGQPEGANPVWLVFDYPSGIRVTLHHTFNVRHPGTWAWTVHDLGSEIRRPALLDVVASDPGSDDLTFHVDWGDGTKSKATLFADGVGPDPYPSPAGEPASGVASFVHDYAAPGTYMITIDVFDDDGGVATVRVGW